MAPAADCIPMPRPRSLSALSHQNAKKDSRVLVVKRPEFESQPDDSPSESRDYVGPSDYEVVDTRRRAEKHAPRRHGAPLPTKERQVLKAEASENAAKRKADAFVKRTAAIDAFERGGYVRHQGMLDALTKRLENLGSVVSPANLRALAKEINDNNNTTPPTLRGAHTALKRNPVLVATFGGPKNAPTMLLNALKFGVVGRDFEPDVVRAFTRLGVRILEVAVGHGGAVSKPAPVQPTFLETHERDCELTDELYGLARARTVAERAAEERALKAKEAAAAKDAAASAPVLVGMTRREAAIALRKRSEANSAAAVETVHVVRAVVPRQVTRASVDDIDFRVCLAAASNAGWPCHINADENLHAIHDRLGAIASAFYCRLAFSGPWADDSDSPYAFAQSLTPTMQRIYVHAYAEEVLKVEMGGGSAPEDVQRGGLRFGLVESRLKEYLGLDGSSSMRMHGHVLPGMPFSRRVAVHFEWNLRNAPCARLSYLSTLACAVEGFLWRRKDPDPQPPAEQPHVACIFADHMPEPLRLDDASRDDPQPQADQPHASLDPCENTMGPHCLDAIQDVTHGQPHPVPPPLPSHDDEVESFLRVLRRADARPEKAAVERFDLPPPEPIPEPVKPVRPGMGKSVRAPATDSSNAPAPPAPRSGVAVVRTVANPAGKESMTAKEKNRANGGNEPSRRGAPAAAKHALLGTAASALPAASPTAEQQRASMEPQIHAPANPVRAEPEETPGAFTANGNEHKTLPEKRNRHLIALPHAPGLLLEDDVRGVSVAPDAPIALLSKELREGIKLRTDWYGKPEEFGDYISVVQACAEPRSVMGDFRTISHRTGSDEGYAVGFHVEVEITTMPVGLYKTVVELASTDLWDSLCRVKNLVLSAVTSEKYIQVVRKFTVDLRAVVDGVLPGAGRSTVEYLLNSENYLRRCGYYNLPALMRYGTALVATIVSSHNALNGCRVDCSSLGTEWTQYVAPRTSAQAEWESNVRDGKCVLALSVMMGLFLCLLLGAVACFLFFVYLPFKILVMLSTLAFTALERPPRPQTKRR